MNATLTVGMENVDGALSKVHVFVVNTRRRSGEDSEEHVMKARRELGVFKTGIIGQADAVRECVSPEINGKWTQANFSVEHGALLKIFANVKARHNAVPVAHSVYVRADDNADLIRLRIRLSGHSRCTHSHVQMLGRFVILTLEEAVRLGAPQPNPDWARQFMRIGAPHSLFEPIEVLEGGVRPQGRRRDQSTAAAPAVAMQTRSRRRPHIVMPQPVAIVPMEGVTLDDIMGPQSRPAGAAPVANPLPTVLPTPEPVPDDAPRSPGGLQRRRRAM
jgi:hypothetical protein